MRIALFCATRRGCLFLRKLRSVAPDADLIVCSFAEEPHEPPFLDDIRSTTQALGGRFVETRRVGGEDLRDFWAANPVDLIFAVSWRYLIPPDLYRRARKGSFVFHDSLLPRYRGFAPTVWAIINGEDHTGATLFAMSERADEGDIVDQQRVPILPDETIADVMQRVTDAYLELLERNFSSLARGVAIPKPQDHSIATYCCRRFPRDNQIDWRRPTREIFNLIRATTRPYPGAFTWMEGRQLIVWSAASPSSSEPPPRYVGRVPGRVVEVSPARGCTVLTADGALTLTELQSAGAQPRPAAEVIDKPGCTLGCPVEGGA
jgi:methionyl-tRNA formyltransferase